MNEITTEDQIKALKESIEYWRDRADRGRSIADGRAFAYTQAERRDYRADALDYILRQYFNE